MNKENDVLEQLSGRKSVRVFTDEPITEEEREQILTAASQAPTAGGMQLYSILEIRDPKIKEVLAERCDHQPFIAKAPLVWIFLADRRKWQELFSDYGIATDPMTEADLFLAMDDALIAAQNAVTAAWSLGIGSCYIGDILEHYEENKELLHLPRYTAPCCMLVFGKPVQQQKDRVKPVRLANDDLVHVDVYNDKGKEPFVRQMEAERKRPVSEENLKAMAADTARRKFTSDFHTEMARSVRAILADWCDEKDPA